MRFNLYIKALAMALAIGILGGCAATKPYDYTAFRESRPRSILVLPPLNSTPDVRATYSMLSHMTSPLAEAGYYVFPVTLVDETFRENGLAQPTEMHAAPPAKLREIFGADAALYVNVTKYGASFQVLNSATVVSADAKLVDLKTGKTLWAKSATASSSEGQNQVGGGLAGLLITAIVKHFGSESSDCVDCQWPFACGWCTSRYFVWSTCSQLWQRRQLRHSACPLA
jgi:hypothetical protein